MKYSIYDFHTPYFKKVNLNDSTIADKPAIADINESLYKAAIDSVYSNKNRYQLYASETFNDFIMEELNTNEYAYGDIPDLKYTVEEYFKIDSDKASMAIINIATQHVFTSPTVTIENFFILISSLDKWIAQKIYMAISLIFLSNDDSSAAEGSLFLLEKFGSGQKALETAMKIRNFEHSYLNKYKDDVISYLRGTI